MCLGEPLSLSLQTIPTPAPVRCVSKALASHADVRCAAHQRKKLEHPYVLPQSVLDAVANLGVSRQAVIRRSGSSRFRALERAAQCAQ
jgi:hypothetical protein